MCFILKDKEVLLLKKSKGLFGQRKWNAPGGNILPPMKSLKLAPSEKSLRRQDSSSGTQKK
jgi:hypothetical protein